MGDALAFAARTPPAFGARLDDTLDRGRAMAFMQFVFRTCTRAQLENLPEEEIRDALRVELVTCFRSTRQQLIDIAAEQPKILTTDAVKTSDVVITMGCGDTCPFYPGKRYEDWVLDDPAGQGIESVRPIRDEIRRRVEALLAELLPAA